MRRLSLLVIILVIMGLAQTGAKYLVITHDNYYDAIQPLVQWKHKKGMKTQVVMLSQIGSTADAIRNYIVNAYNTWDIKPEYLLLVGAPNYLPFPSASGTVSDNYYANMDGDIFNEILPGRLTVHNTTEAQTVVNKILLYERTPYMSDTMWFVRACGIVRMDYDSYDDSIYWSDIHQMKSYMLNAEYNLVDTLSSLYGDDKNDVIDRVNLGRSFVLYRGQGVNNWWSPFDVNPDNTANGPKLPIVLSITCSTIGTGSSPATAEKWLLTGSPTQPRGGAGFFATTTVIGGGAYLRSAVSKGFFDAIFRDGKRTFGEACEGGRMKVYTMYNSSSEYRGFNTLGDPEMNIWTAVPHSLDVTYPMAVPIGSQPFTVEVDDHNGNPLPGAVVCLLKGDEVYAVDSTGANGLVTLNINPLNLGTMYVTVTANNKLPFEDSAQIIVAQGPYVVLDDYLINDIGGNNDSLVDIGEPIQLWSALENVGVQVAEEVYAVLATQDPYITITNNYSYFGDIDTAEIVWGQDAYDFSAAAVCPDNHEAIFSITAADLLDSNWVSSFDIPVHAPVLVFDSYVINDSSGGNNNGRLEPGETAQFFVTLGNHGSGYANTISATLSSVDPYVTVTNGIANYPNILPGANGVCATPYVITAQSSCPAGYEAQLDLTIHAQAGYARYDAGYVTVGGFYDNMENGIGTWTHAACSTGFTDQWHQSTQRNHTPGGTTSWKCGATGTENYANFLDAGLVTPQLTLPTNPIVHFWHRMNAEVSGSYPGEAYDGGLLEINAGSGWVQITPQGGYPYVARAGSGGPFTQGVPIYSGSFDWTEALFDLSAYSGQNVQIRFRFGSDQGTAAEGWYIDDMMITSQPVITVSIDADTTEVSRNTPLGYTITLRNMTSSNQTFNGLIEAWLPNGSAYSGNPLVGPVTISLGPNQTRVVRRTQMIPGSAPLGEYLFRIKINSTMNQLIDQDFCRFRVIP